jgi:3-dehydrosphinganine reductase
MTRHALISGGSSGIGFALARQLTEQGWRLSLLARGAERLAMAAEQLRAAGALSVTCQAVDVKDEAATALAVQAAMAVEGVPDLVVTSAGIARPGYFEELASTDFEEAMAVNYFGTLHVLRAVLPTQRARGSGHVVLVSSGAGLTGIFGYAAYAPSKFAVRGLAEVLRNELMRDGVNVSVVFPPDTDTPQLAAENLTKPAETFAIAGNARLMTADEVAKTILRGIERKAFSITPGLEMSLLARWGSVIAPILHRYFDHVVAKSNQQRTTP